ncbi:hypothetical protein FBU59_001221 [Linderina macrospora]|uniref:Uncharacterized protein n=1 Tax=Linderina macrospora TaxID=4868 RepID=A0ACC1JEG2_9FUNG|nr:hypothetical protein FBU59_001221 [Linderina macrospora]
MACPLTLSEACVAMVTQDLKASNNNDPVQGRLVLQLVAAGNGGGEGSAQAAG